MEISIREWTANDIPAAAMIERTCLGEPWSLDTLKQWRSAAHFFAYVLEADGVIAGYVCGTALFEDAELLRVAVLPPYRGKGFGKLLTERFLEGAAARGAERAFLEVRPSNQAALALYQKQGFQKNRLRKRYYADGEDGLEMMKSFDPERE